MVRPKRRRAAAAVAVAAALTAASLAAPARADAPDGRGAPPAPSPHASSRTQTQQEAKETLVKQIAKDHGVPAAEAARRADRQPAQFGLAARLGKDLGAAYGGAWIDQGRGGELTSASPRPPRRPRCGPRPRAPGWAHQDEEGPVRLRAPPAGVRLPGQAGRRR